MILKSGDEAYVLGNAAEENGEFLVGDGKFLLSDQSEEELSAAIGLKKWALLGVTVLFVVGALYFLLLA